MRQFIFTEAEKEPVKNMTEKEHAAWWRDLKAKGDPRTLPSKCIGVVEEIDPRYPHTEARLVGATKSFLDDIDRQVSNERL